MPSLPAAEVALPRLPRAVALQALALVAALLALELPWRKAPPVVEPEPPKPVERRIRVVKLEPPAQKPLPKPPEVAQKPPQPVPKPPPPQQAAPKPPPPQAVVQPAPPQAPQEPPPPQQQAVQPQPRRAEPKPQQAPRPAPAKVVAAAAPARQHIAADSTAVHGVRLRVLVPRSPAELASHLRNSGGCLVVSKLGIEGAEVLSVLGSDGRELQEPPCGGVPRLLRDANLNFLLGDPLGRARAALPVGERGGEVVLQVLLTPRLPALAQAALHARFGPLSEDELARKAAESGYELTCFAEPAGALRCQ